MVLPPLFKDFSARHASIAVVGLGYVGLPLAVALARHFKLIGFDMANIRINELKSGYDRTGEVDGDSLAAAEIEFTSDPRQLSRAKFIIVAVPTPIDSHRTPDLALLLGASATVAKNMSKGSVIVYESTVYPGTTEEQCIPVLEKESGMRNGKDFFIGYSPERINPGDKIHTVEKIIKVVSGSTDETLELVASIYGAVVTAGIHKAPSIKVAEAAKVIENTQRDLNIALMNELSIIFDKLGIDTLDVLAAAETKWNFLPFRPGLVGGHCIGVDPYYLTYKAEEVGYHPEVILAGRRINDNMGKYVAEKAVKLLIKTGCIVRQARVGILGLTFKENVPDLRNTRVVDIKNELEEFGVNVLVHDPMADPEEARHEYNIELLQLPEMTNLHAIILAVGHKAYSQVALTDLSKNCVLDSPILLDLKGRMNAQDAVNAGFTYWRL